MGAAVTTDFGELIDIDVRQAWHSEPQDFTPWLAGHLEALSKALGFEPPLDEPMTEHAIGPFSADIIAMHPDTGHRALIENQLEVSDHTHLGQVMTYLAGSEARTVVWVAREFRDEHLSAIKWLNEHTTSEFAFFAVKVRAVRIGDSPIAPLFDVLERPNVWDRGIRDTAAQSGSSLTIERNAFWSYYAERFPDDGVPASRKDSNHYVRVPLHDVLISLFLYADGVGIYVRRNWSDTETVHSERFERLTTNLKEQLQNSFSDTAPNIHAAVAEIRVTWRDVSGRERAADWLHERLHTYLSALENIAPVQDDGFPLSRE